MLKYVVKLYKRLSKMDTPDLLDNLIHDQVVLASAATYNAQKLDELGLKVNVNLLGSRLMFVGTQEDHIYPDVLVWKPESPNASKGKTVIAEVIETKKTLDSNPARWKALANKVGIIFYLIVPKGEEAKVILSLNALEIRNQTKLQTWHWDSTQKKYLFESVT